MSEITEITKIIEITQITEVTEITEIMEITKNTEMVGCQQLSQKVDLGSRAYHIYIYIYKHEWPMNGPLIAINSYY